MVITRNRIEVKIHSDIGWNGMRNEKLFACNSANDEKLNWTTTYFNSIRLAFERSSGFIDNYLSRCMCEQPVQRECVLCTWPGWYRYGMNVNGPWIILRHVSHRSSAFRSKIDIFISTSTRIAIGNLCREDILATSMVRQSPEPLIIAAKHRTHVRRQITTKYVWSGHIH